MWYVIKGLQEVKFRCMAGILSGSGEREKAEHAHWVQMVASQPPVGEESVTTADPWAEEGHNRAVDWQNGLWSRGVLEGTPKSRKVDQVYGNAV